MTNLVDDVRGIAPAQAYVVNGLLGLTCKSLPLFPDARRRGRARRPRRHTPSPLRCAHGRRLTDTAGHDVGAEQLWPARMGW